MRHVQGMSLQRCNQGCAHARGWTGSRVLGKRPGAPELGHRRTRDTRTGLEAAAAIRSGRGRRLEMGLGCTWKESRRMGFFPYTIITAPEILVEKISREIDGGNAGRQIFFRNQAAKKPGNSFFLYSRRNEIDT